MCHSGGEQGGLPSLELINALSTHNRSTSTPRSLSRTWLSMLCLGAISTQATAPSQRWRFTAFTKGSETYVSQPNCSTSTPLCQAEFDSPGYAEGLRDDINAGNGPWPEVAFMMFPMCSETYVPHWPNCSTYTPIPQARLDYPCYAEYLRDKVNTGNGWPEVAFMTFTMGSETCVSQHNRLTSTLANLTIHAMSSISGAVSTYATAPSQRWCQARVLRHAAPGNPRHVTLHIW